MTQSGNPGRPPLLRAIGAGNDTTALGLRSLSWTAPTLLIAVLALALGVFASTVTYAKRQPTMGALVPGDGALRITPPRAGVVTALFVAEGQAVAAGDALFTLGFGQALEQGGTLDAALNRSLDSQEALLRDQIAAETGRAENEDASLAAQVEGFEAERSAIETQRALQDRRAGVAEDLARTAADLRVRNLLPETDLRLREDAALAAWLEVAVLDQRLAAMAAKAAEARHRRVQIATDAA